MELLKLGAAAEAALRKGITDTDPQVRDLARQVLDHLLETTRTARLKAFLEDRDERSSPPLTGWKRFAAVAGNGPAERKRFVELYRKGEKALEEVEARPQERRQNPRYAHHPGPAATPVPSSDAAALRELATMLLLAVDPRLPLDATASRRVCGVLAILAERAAVLKAFGADMVCRKLTRAFLTERCDPGTRVAALSAAVGLDLTETADWSLELTRWARTIRAPCAAGP